MAILALISDSDQPDQVIPWAINFARALDSSLTILCWAHGRTAELDAELSACRGLLGKCEAVAQRVLLSESIEASPPVIKYRVALHPNRNKAATEIALEGNFQLLVAAATDQTGKHGASIASNPLLRHSPCHTVLLYGGSQRSKQTGRVLVGSRDTPHDKFALYLASRMAVGFGSRVTLGRVERDFEQVGEEVGHRVLQDLIRDADIDNGEQIDCRVFRTVDTAEILQIQRDQDLLLVGANNRHLSSVIEHVSKPTVAVIRRAPKIWFWRRGPRPANWIRKLSKADYADLYEGLRRGSRLNADFMIMLCLAAVVASLGLLQDSPAVVIGSMLLAPLMTPMLGCGLALAQANSRLGNRALLSVATGLSCTLLISALVGYFTPVAELAPQVLARGNPNVLDLFVASASAAAAAYALARPGLVGSIAGVAIATALVPPLCSLGLALTYQNYSTAWGAGLLFITNFLAIVLVAALTFRLMGVRFDPSSSRQRMWAYRTQAVMNLAVILVVIPLYLSLQQSLFQTSPQPLTHPLTSQVNEALEQFVDLRDDVELISAGRPSVQQGTGADIALVVGAPGPLDPGYADQLVEIIRSKMEDDSLSVEVHCVQEQWHRLIR